jgi:DNA-binding HxlR family transcriptional regulator
MKIDNKEYRLEIGNKQYHCVMDVTMDYVGGKWKTVVLWYLRNNKKRFTELKNHIPQITERMLSITLKQLEQDGIISRKVFTTKPPLKVEYELTKFGKTLLPLLEAIALWGRGTAKSKGKLTVIN